MPLIDYYNRLKTKRINYFLYVILFILIFYFDWIYIVNIVLGVTPYRTHPDSTRYLLSALVQSEAAILAIIVTLSLVAVQLASSSYSIRTMDIFKKTSYFPDFWFIICLYISAIILGSFVLRFIDAIDINGKNVEIEHLISLSYHLSIFAFLALIPYTLNIFNLLNPAKIIGVLSKKITYNNIRGKQMGDDNDPIQPITDIIISSITRRDEGTIETGLNMIVSKMNHIFTKRRKDPEAVKLFIHHLMLICDFAISRDDGVAIIKLIKCIEDAEPISTTNGIDVSVYIRYIGVKTIKNGLINQALNCAFALERLGVKMGKQHDENMLRGITTALQEIGVEAVEQNVDEVACKVASALGKIGGEAADQNTVSIADEAARGLSSIGLKAVDKNIINVVHEVVSSLGNIGIKSISAKPTGQHIRSVDGLQCTLSLKQIGLEALNKMENCERFACVVWDVQSCLSTFKKVIEYRGSLDAKETMTIQFCDEFLKNQKYLTFQKSNVFKNCIGVMHVATKEDFKHIFQREEIKS